MKKLILITSIIIVVLTACKENKKEIGTDTNVQDSTAIVLKTYAELSIAEGGKWKERVYEGGTSFKNVDELWVPKRHTDHSWYLRYEGPGWESNKVGYRLYLDWRNAIDIFGKITDSIVLDQVGQDGFDSYHEKQKWGQDILKVGKALGLGSYGRLVADSVHHFQNVDSTYIKVNNNKKASGVNIRYHGWATEDIKTDLDVSLSIKPDSRMTRTVLSTSKSVEGLVTGIVKSEGVDLIVDNAGNSEWGYIATYGEQTLVPDNLGMVIFYKKDEVISLVDGAYDHLLLFKPTEESITYRFGAVWEGEKNGVKTKEGFLSYLKDELNNLNSVY
ncbi:hypothetical protein GGR42_002279 [Saonia flava]|uniref:DUF4861 domain-containing protein n=1 Tax=Saonia flava TaxID=523696 RepID=A0A846QX76_9FLAO|nr:DUF4861 family protein [Saonia flava]NJB71817.1 hypothetical protein [Saonia flava]